jgi:hypothetical protein
MMIVYEGEERVKILCLKMKDLIQKIKLSLGSGSIAWKGEVN